MVKRGLVGAVVAVLLTVPVSGGAETPTEKRLRQLEETLRKTEDELRELHRQLDQQKAIGQATQKQVEQTAEETKTATAEAKKAVELPDWLKRTTVFGDVRYRHEGFYHQPHLQNFFDAVRGKATLNCPAEEAYQTAVAVLKVNEAIEARAPVAFKPEDFKV